MGIFDRHFLTAEDFVNEVLGVHLHSAPAMSKFQQNRAGFVTIPDTYTTLSQLKAAITNRYRRQVDYCGRAQIVLQERTMTAINEIVATFLEFSVPNARDLGMPTDAYGSTVDCVEHVAKSVNLQKLADGIWEPHPWADTDAALLIMKIAAYRDRDWQAELSTKDASVSSIDDIQAAIAAEEAKKLVPELTREEKIAQMFR